MAKMVKADDNGEQEMARYEAPERVQPSLPANAMRLADLCNGGDIVLRGPGLPFDTEHGQATPVFFQDGEEYMSTGPITLEMAYTQDGHEYLTGKAVETSDMTEDDVPRAVYQFLTSSVVILRAARNALKNAPETGFVARVTTKRSISTGRDYYILE